MFRTRLLTLLLACTSLLTAEVAVAQPFFLDFFKDPPLGDDGEPVPEWFVWNGECELCHQTRAGSGPVTTPFGQSLVAANPGSVIGNVDNLKLAVAALLGDPEADVPPTDSDEDGVGDIDELFQGSDPNDPGCSTLGCYTGFTGADPEFGCVGSVASARSQPGPERAPLFAAFLTACALVLTRRRQS